MEGVATWGRLKTARKKRGLICMPYMYALYVSLICMPYMYALYVCPVYMPWRPQEGGKRRVQREASHVCPTCMPYMYALYVCLICV